MGEESFQTFQWNYSEGSEKYVSVSLQLSSKHYETPFKRITEKCQPACKILLSADSYPPKLFFPVWLRNAHEKAKITVSASTIKMSRMADNLSISVKTLLTSPDKFVRKSYLIRGNERLLMNDVVSVCGHVQSQTAAGRFVLKPPLKEVANSA